MTRPRRKTAARARRATASASLQRLVEVLRWNEQGLIPAVIQDATSRRVLTVCYLNPQALEKSFQEGRVYVFRRSQHRVMLKGETSGHVQRIRRWSVDCESKSLLLEIDQHVACCHTGYFSCYFRRVGRGGRMVLADRKVFDPAKVYRAL